MFLREVASREYDLDELRRRQRAAPRVRGRDVVVDDGTVGHTKSKATNAPWRIGPGDDPFLTQTLQVHFVELPPGASKTAHGHQNEAAFYILEGHGYEIHDGKRYDWSAGDLVVVNTDSVHAHHNESDEPAVALVIKAKALWMYLGLTAQGLPRAWNGSDAFAERVDWSQLWTPGVEAMAKVVKSNEGARQLTEHGFIRVLTTDAVRLFSVDLYEQDIPPSSRSSRHWHMADEVLYVLSGSGHSLHWGVDAEITDKYHARVERRPTRHDIESGDTLYIPSNTVHQHFSDDGSEPLRLLSAQNRIFKLVGYDNVVTLEPAPEYKERSAR